MTNLMAAAANYSTLDSVQNPIRYILNACEEARPLLPIWADAGRIEPLVLMRNQADAVRAHAIRLRLGKPSELAPTEIVRRCERALVHAIDVARLQGELCGRNGGPGKTLGDYGLHTDSVSEFRMTAACTDREFDKAIAEATAEGSLSRAALIRKLTGKRAAVPKLTRVLGAHASAATQRRSMTAAIAALSGITHGLSQFGDLHPDITSEEAAQWVDGLSQARRTLEIQIKRLRERSNV